MPAPLETRIRIVQSRSNSRLKDLRAALSKPSAALIGLEGEHLILEALRSNIHLQTIFVRSGSEHGFESLLQHYANQLASTELLSVAPEAFASTLTTENPQAMAALAIPPSFTLAASLSKATHPALVVVLAALQDPGNAGTILRSAEAFGATAVITLPGTASIWNPKTLRSSAGSAFRLPVIAATEEEAFSHLAAQGITNIATVAPAHPSAQPLSAALLTGPTALWLGNEGSGLSPSTIQNCQSAVTITYPGQVESLNAAIAASVLLYEAARQRSIIQAGTA